MGEALEFHPLANLFPLIEGQAFDDLVADVKAKSLREKIVMFEGKILDGRNRYRAAVAAGLIDPSGETDMGNWDPRFFRHHQPRKDGDPLAFVLSLNLHRRHLTTSQRAMIAAQIGRIGHGGNQSKASYEGLTLDARATQLSVGRASVERAEIVVDKGVPELCDAVKAGTVTVAAASGLATLPKDQQLAALRSADADVLYKVLAEERARKQAAKKLRREERNSELADKIKAANAALPAMIASGKRYGLILEDPEWPWEAYSEETGMDRAEENHYPTSSLAEICARPIGDLAARDCVYLIWATPPRLELALAVMKARGFTYKTHRCWRKVLPGKARGRGYWFHFTHELVLLGTRGSPPCPAMGEQWDSVFDAARGANSAKPDDMHRWADRFFPGVPKLECNARTAWPGWDVWGAEAPEPVPAAACDPALFPAPAALKPTALEDWAGGLIDLPALPGLRTATNERVEPWIS